LKQNNDQFWLYLCSVSLIMVKTGRKYCKLVKLILPNLRIKIGSKLMRIKVLKVQTWLQAQPCRPTLLLFLAELRFTN